MLQNAQAAIQCRDKSVSMNDTPVTRPSLLLRVRDVKDDLAWREFVEIYTPLVYTFCRNRGLQEGDAADVSQEVMRVVSQAMPEFQYDAARGKFRGWLLQITRHRLYKFFDRQRRSPQSASETTVERFFNQEPGVDEQTRWDEDFRQRLFDWAAEKARAEFQSTTWEAFWLTSVQSVSVKEVAARLGISIGAVYIARSRVIARLRELIETVADDTFETSDH
jgi:RNA polymerase sigma factor (sigma-70 family)